MTDLIPVDLNSIKMDAPQQSDNVASLVPVDINKIKMDEPPPSPGFYDSYVKPAIDYVGNSRLANTVTGSAALAGKGMYEEVGNTYANMTRPDLSPYINQETYERAANSFPDTKKVSEQGWNNSSTPEKFGAVEEAPFAQTGPAGEITAGLLGMSPYGAALATGLGAANEAGEKYLGVPHEYSQAAEMAYPFRGAVADFVTGTAKQIAATSKAGLLSPSELASRSAQYEKAQATGVADLPEYMNTMPTGAEPSSAQQTTWRGLINEAYHEKAGAPYSTGAQLYDIYEKAGAGKTMEPAASDNFLKQFDDYIDNLKNDPSFATNPKKSTLFNQLNKVRDSIGENPVSYDTLRQIDQAITEGGNSANIGTAGGFARGNAQAFIRNAIDNLPDKSFGIAGRNARDYWSNEVVKPFFEGDGLGANSGAIWNRNEDYYPWAKNLATAEPMSPFDVNPRNAYTSSATRDVNFIRNIKTADTVDALARILKPEDFADIMKAKSRMGDPDNPALSRIIGESTSGFLHPTRFFNALGDTVRYITGKANPSADEIQRYADGIRDARAAYNRQGQQPRQPIGMSGEINPSQQPPATPANATPLPSPSPVRPSPYQPSLGTRPNNPESPPIYMRDVTPRLPTPPDMSPPSNALPAPSQGSGFIAGKGGVRPRTQAETFNASDEALKQKDVVWDAQAAHWRNMGYNQTQIEQKLGARPSTAAQGDSVLNSPGAQTLQDIAKGKKRGGRVLTPIQRQAVNKIVKKTQSGRAA